jgi:hypothetical protein
MLRFPSSFVYRKGFFILNEIYFMRRSLILFVIGCFVILQANAQSDDYEKPDFAVIKSNCENRASRFYYPLQMKRYVEDDTTLSVEEYRFLYYGFSFQPEYSPYGKSAVLDQLREALKKEKMTPEEIDKAIGLEKKVLKEFPFNLRNLNMLVRLYDEKGDSVNADKTYKKLLGVGRAILSTGDGRADSSAMYVISVEHEYDMIGLLEYRYGGSQTLVHYKNSSLDYLTLADNKYLTKGLYFNVDRLFAVLEEQLKKKN